MTTATQTSRQMVGKVISDKRNKTRTVELSWAERHPLYKKVVRRQTICQVHDEDNQSSEGDIVEICQTRPISKTKTWALVSVVEKAQKV